MCNNRNIFSKKVLINSMITKKTKKIKVVELVYTIVLETIFKIKLRVQVPSLININVNYKSNLQEKT